MAQKINSSQIQGQDYSTTEVNTGRKWINGKDIYRKVIVFDKGTSASYNLGIGSDIEDVVFNHIIIRNSTAARAPHLVVPYYGNSTSFATAYRNSATNYNIYVGGDYTAGWRYGVMVLEYTKI